MKEKQWQQRAMEELLMSDAFYTHCVRIYLEAILFYNGIKIRQSSFMKSAETSIDSMDSISQIHSRHRHSIYSAVNVGSPIGHVDPQSHACP